MHDEMNLETDRFKLIFTTSVVSAQIWAINMAANGNGNVEIGTDRFRSIFTMCVARAQTWAMDIVNHKAKWQMMK